MINANDYAQIEAAHSDHDGISSGADEENDDDGNEKEYDLNDSFINNQTQSPLKTQQMFAYRKAMKTPQFKRNRIFGKNRLKWMDKLQSIERRACEEADIDSSASYDDMEGYEDPDDPIYPPWDAEKEGIHYQNSQTSSDDDVCFIFFVPLTF